MAEQNLTSPDGPQTRAVDPSPGRAIHPATALGDALAVERRTTRQSASAVEYHLIKRRESRGTLTAPVAGPLFEIDGCAVEAFRVVFGKGADVAVALMRQAQEAPPVRLPSAHPDVVGGEHFIADVFGGIFDTAFCAAGEPHLRAQRFSVRQSGRAAKRVAKRPKLEGSHLWDGDDTEESQYLERLAREWRCATNRLDQMGVVGEAMAYLRTLEREKAPVQGHRGPVYKSDAYWAMLPDDPRSDRELGRVYGKDHKTIAAHREKGREMARRELV